MVEFHLHSVVGCTKVLGKAVELKDQYEELGYFVIRNFFSEQEIESIKSDILTFHHAWIDEHKIFYQEDAFNSSLITGSQYLNQTERLALFNFISSNKMMNLIETIIPQNPAFMNTQLFFNPPNPELKDFWHRDCQYDHEVAEQKIAVQENQVVHFRIPLFDELGMELVPGTHKRWDNEEEFNVRQEINGFNSNDALSTGKTIPLSSGDLLVFSADMIHRGLYGLERLAWDILMFDTSGDFADYVDPDCLPEKSMLDKIQNAQIFQKTIDLIA